MSPQQRDAAREHLVRHDASAPDALDELFARDDFAGALDQAHEDVHDLGFEADGAARTQQRAVVRAHFPGAEAKPGFTVQARWLLAPRGRVMTVAF